MKLHGKALQAGIFHSLAAAVVGVDKNLSAHAGKTFADHGVTVILAGDIGAVAADLPHRLVGSPVPVMQFFGLAAHGKRRQLMPEADAEHRKFSDKLCDLRNAPGIFRRVAGTVGKHNAVRLQGKHLLRRRVLRQDVHPTATLPQ